MGKKDKKKGKGAEKTALKTEKKALSKMKKDLAARGEVDIETLIAKSQEQDPKKVFAAEEQSPPPTPRSGFTLCAHPDKEMLVLFGGEFYNGRQTVMYNDLYLYNIKKNQWSILQFPVKPPPRCSHQAVAVSQGGGQMWVFGGEFASPSRSQFHHYRDLWVYLFAEHRWELVKAPGAPPARSGHRMVVGKKRIVVFGGFFENMNEYRYFNDVFIFSLETYSWTKIEPVGKVPSCRSGFQMAALPDGRILVYGGYSREKVKKDVDKATAHTDMFYLQADERVNPPKWKWVQSKPTGVPPSGRSGLSMTTAANSSQAYAFGGSQDEDDDEEILTSIFHNDFYILDLDVGRWSTVAYHDKALRKRKRRVRDEVSEALENTSLHDTQMQETAAASVETYKDNVFSVTIGPGNSAAVSSSTTTSEPDSDFDPNIPKARMNAGLAVKNGILYLYGGIYEEDDKHLTLSDFYSIDIRKMDEWKTIIPFTTKDLQWIESEESSSGDDSDDDDMEESDDDDDAMDTM